MTGFLDQNAPSAESEYSRYIDGDILGKIVTKNFLINRAGYSQASIFIPLGRYGDADIKYEDLNSLEHDPGDGHLLINGERLTFEIKCARVNIANRHRGGQGENWAFTNLLRSPKGVQKTYDLLIAIGIRVLGLEDSRYWDYLRELEDQYRIEGRVMDIQAMPHQELFLSLCSFFVIPRQSVPNNYFRLMVKGVHQSNFAKYWARGDDFARCHFVWRQALEESVHYESTLLSRLPDGRGLMADVET